MSTTPEDAGGWLRIDLDAIAENYRRIQSSVARKTTVGAAVKADAYGLGAAQVAPKLQRAGCAHFFVAAVSEGIGLRAALGPDANIFLLNGPFPGSEETLVTHGIIPVLNSMTQISRWATLGQQNRRRMPSVIQLDSGMSRFGLNAHDLGSLGTFLPHLELRLVMSHLACADEPGHDLNAAQQATFRRLRADLPPAPTSLAASSGVFLGPDYHFDLVRPGYALYGGNPTPDKPNPMQPVVSLHIRMVQDRWINPGASVGYGARFIAQKATRIATLASGYADGLPRSAGGRAFAILPERPDCHLPFVGRVSMDCLALDITALGDMPLPAGTPFEVIGHQMPLDSLATELDTIGYELLTSLGDRYHRAYIENSL